MEYSIANEIKSQTRVVGNIYAYLSVRCANRRRTEKKRIFQIVWR